MIWDRSKIDSGLVEVWWERIRHYTYVSLESGFNEYIETQPNFPVPGTVIPLIKKQFGYRDERRKNNLW